MRAVLIDENFPGLAASGLEAAGHDVKRVAVVAPGLDDLSVLALARAERRCLLSFDADFGELVFHRGAAAPPAILFFRVHPVTVDEVIELALRALDKVPDGAFGVITRDGTRVRPFAPRAALP